MAKKEKKQKTEFSKALLIWETVLIVFITVAFLALVYFCIRFDYSGDLTWLSIIYGCPWAAYAVSQACYYKKAEKENTKGGIKYDSVVRAAREVLEPETIEKIKEVVRRFEEEESEEVIGDEEIVEDEEAMG